MTTRRELLELGAVMAAGAALHPVHAAEATAGSLLILGGTGFIGPHLTEEAQRLGWKVTHFNRGRHVAGGVPGVQTLIGDRRGELDALRGRKWDAVVDDTGYVPKFVRMSAELLAPNVGYCLYISSIAAYASFTAPNDEDSPLGRLPDPQSESVTATTYGPMKALCEQYSAEAFKGRCSIVRPGYVVGPLDPTDRFTYWPVRASKGGEMLAPGTPADPIQFIDVRDLTAFMMKLVGSHNTGVFNADSPPRARTMGGLIGESQRASPGAGTTVTWVAEDFLAAHWRADRPDLTPWEPTKGDSAGAALTAVDRARRAGLRCRPPADSVRDTLAWFQTLPPERQAKLHSGPDAAKEAETLRAWHAQRKNG